jgi:hypothetical protein
MLDNKQCSKCKQNLSIDNFYTRNDTACGYASQCKKCEAARKSKSLENLKVKGYRLNTETHKWCPSCKTLLENSSFYKNLSQTSGLRSECKKCHNIREKSKGNLNPTYRLRKNVSRAINKMLNGKQKSSSCMTYLPFTLQQLKEYLESKFDDNMSWDNYGSYWDLDHIYPQSLLEYDSMQHENFLKTWNLNNLQPLPKIENIKKSNKKNLTNS